MINFERLIHIKFPNNYQNHEKFFSIFSLSRIGFKYFAISSLFCRGNLNNTNFTIDRVPEEWITHGFSSRKLISWLTSIELCIQQYKIFESKNAPPKIIFINRLFNPLFNNDIYHNRIVIKIVFFYL